MQIRFVSGDILNVDVSALYISRAYFFSFFFEFYFCFHFRESLLLYHCAIYF